MITIPLWSFIVLCIIASIFTIGILIVIASAILYSANNKLHQIKSGESMEDRYIE